jgi:pimeloyl-ACP methyl ester carboxylesterase
LTRPTRVAFSLAFAAALLSVAKAGAAASPELGLHLQPCVQGHTKARAECGTFGVYEDRATRSGRIIELNVVVLKARHHSRGAIAEIAGGPGQAATEFAGFLADAPRRGTWSALRDDYDFIFVDNRGMGKSNPFKCDFAPPGNPAAYFGQLYPNDLVATCRKASAQTRDLAQYNTQNAVDDLDDVRAALGYPKIVVDGGSYGTFFSLVYIRRHPQHVQAAILDGVTPPHFQPVPGEPMGVQHALDDLISKCRGDARCNARFPQFAQHFAAIVRRLAADPVSVPVRNPVTKSMQTVTLSKEVFVDQLRHLLYSPDSAAYVPFIVDRAYHGDYAPLATTIQTISEQFAHELNMGAFLSYSCADWMPFVTQGQIAEAKAHSFAGDLRFEAQRVACAIWNVPAMPASFNDPVLSTAPVLMILGSDDPATPPQYGEQALRYLPNGRAVLVTGGGHGADTRCTDRLVLQFVRSGSAKGLDVSKCTATFQLPPFATSMKGWP